MEEERIGQNGKGERRIRDEGRKGDTGNVGGREGGRQAGVRRTTEVLQTTEAQHMSTSAPASLPRSFTPLAPSLHFSLYSVPRPFLPLPTFPP